MKKAISILTILLLTAFYIKCPSLAEINTVYLAKDAFIPVYPTKVLSTSVYEEGDIFYFIVPSDMWIDEYKIIPKNSIVKAKITMLKMPVTGINAAMKINTEEIIFPNGTHHSITGTITYKGERQIGGDLTPPASYNKSLHPRKGEYYNSVIAQYVPSGEYEFGQHVTIMPNEMLQVVLDEDFTLY